MKSLTQASLAALLCALAAPALAQESPPSFFVTSRGLGDGANLGGVEGADAHCAALAQAAGLQGTNWRAYLSTQGITAENARDRIGSGPWYDVAGTLIAQDVDALHSEEVSIDVDTALDETGAPVPSVPLDEAGNPIPPAERTTPVEHAILTGSQTDGTAFPEGEDMTCSNWTSNTEGEGSTMLGHADRRGLEPGVTPWNAAHPSRGCSQENLISTLGQAASIASSLTEARARRDTGAPFAALTSRSLFGPHGGCRSPERPRLYGRWLVWHITNETAIAAILRPRLFDRSNFFGKAAGDDDDHGAIESDIESIMDEALAARVPLHRLTGHYRSRHESLITFSNHAYYHGELVTYPAADTRDTAVTLKRVDSVYARGKAQTNPVRPLGLSAGVRVQPGSRALPQARSVPWSGVAMVVGSGLQRLVS